MGAEVVEALDGDFTGVDGEVEHFDGDPVGVVDVGEGGEDGGEVDGAGAGVGHVVIVGVEMAEVGDGFADELGGGGGFVGHGFAVEDELHVVVVDAVDEVDDLVFGVEVVGLGAGEGFGAEGDVMLLGGGGDGEEEVDGAPEGGVGGVVVEDVALLGGAMDHAGAAEVGAEFDEFLVVVDGAAAGVGVGAIDVKALGFGQEPVEADDGEVVFVGGVADGAADGGGDQIEGRGEGVGGKLDAGVAGLGGEGAGVFDGPVDAELIAHGELHGMLRAR